jgi:hypothetical protein
LPGCASFAPEGLSTGDVIKGIWHTAEFVTIVNSSSS